MNLTIPAGLFVATGPMTNATAGADTTPPAVTQRPPDGLAADADIIIGFSEAIQPGAGTITLRGPNGFTYTASLTGPDVKVSGNTLIFNPPQQLDFLTNYSVELSPGAVKDLVGNATAMSLFVYFSTGKSQVALNATGTDGADTMHGSDLADVLSGGGGADHLYGYGGDDVLNGGDEPETGTYAFGDNISGGDGNDTIYGNAGNDYLTGDNGNDKLYGGTGNDNLDGGSGDDLLDGGPGKDSLREYSGSNTLLGGEGDDSIGVSSDGTNFVDGGPGNDYISGGMGNDTLSGGAGDDTINVEWGIPGVHTVTVSGGDGDDKIIFNSNYYASRIVIANGDAGADTFQFSSSAAGKFTVAGFSIADGDKIDLLPLLRWDFQGNPFGAVGYFKAEQSGNDTVIYYDSDGAAGTAVSFQPLLVLQGFQLANLSGAAFVGGLDPAGGSTGVSIKGTAGDDTLRGGPLDDTLDGGDGADVLWGSGGNDTLVGGAESAGDKGDKVAGDAGDDIISGGAGDDSLYGGAGNDRLDGGTGNDYLGGDEGDDILDGGAGNDRLEGGLGNDRLAGGDGDDYLSDAYGTNFLDGGAGNDTLSVGYDGAVGTSTLDGGIGDDKLVGGYGNDTLLGGAGKDKIEIKSGTQATTVTVDAGADDDSITLLSSNAGQSVTVTGGGGADTYSFIDWKVQPVLTITDFSAGAGGDKLDVASLFQSGSAALSGNPFSGNKYLRLVQDGANTLLQIDRDGLNGPEQFRTVAVLKGISLGALAASNFSQGADPAGAAQGGVLDGTSGNDVITGSTMDDTISGFAGDDTLYGYGGNDRIDGGDGRDTLDGEKGDDTLLGAAGDDKLLGGEGNDQLEGGAGNDELYGGPGNDRLDGGDGDDLLLDAEGNNTLIGGAGKDRIESGGQGSNHLEGGDGDDVLSSAGGDDTLDGGAGNDVLGGSNKGAAGTAHTVRMNGGAGADWISFDMSGNGQVTIWATGGEGQDTFYLRSVTGAGTLTITDFQPGETGDLLDGFGPYWLNGTYANPFGPAGFLRFEQRGLDVVLQLDADGAAGPGAFKDVATLAGVDLHKITAGNIQGGFNPDGTNTGRTVTGTEGDDKIAGGYTDDNISGAGGNDILSGSYGNDRIDGGAGDDVISGGDGDDVLLGGSGNDSIDSGAGTDTADGGEGDDRLVGSGGGNKTFAGGDGNDTLTVEGAGTSTLNGGAGNDNLTLSKGYGTLDGGDGNDRLSINSWDGGATVPKGRVVMLGGAGDDIFSPFAGLDYVVTATGGTGRDTFARSGTPWSYTVTDFQAGAGGDRIDLAFPFNPTDPKNPFGESGYFRLVQDGADTVLEYDSDGAAGTYEGFKPAMRLEGVSAAALVADNFVRFYDPRPVTGQNLVGTSGDNLLEGGAGEDKLDGGAGNDILVGGGGNDTLLGGTGLDTARYAGAASRYDVTRVAGVGFVVNDRDGKEGIDTLTGVERVVFSDQALALDINGVAGQAYRIYRAAFDRVPDLSGMGFWLKQMDNGVTVEQAAGGFIASEEFTKLYGAAPSNTEIVDRLYRNVLHRAPEQGGYDFWVDVLNGKKASLAAVLAAFSEGAENKAAVAELIGQGIAYEPYGG